MRVQVSLFALINVVCIMFKLLKNKKNKTKTTKRDFCIVHDPLFVDELINRKKRKEYSNEEIMKLNSNIQSQQQQIPYKE